MPTPLTTISENCSRTPGPPGPPAGAGMQTAPATASAPPRPPDDTWAEWLERTWDEVIRLLPVDLEATARATGALQRRRTIRTAASLLRLLLVYCLEDWSLLLTGAWAVQTVGALSAPAIRQRLQRAQGWLQVLVTACLGPPPPETARPPVRLRLVDATTSQGLNSTGTDWRLHLSFDVGGWQLSGIEVTDAHGGETLVRHSAEPGDILVADRGYAHRRGLGHVLAEHADVVVRINWQNLPLLNGSREAFPLLSWLSQIPAAGWAEAPVEVVTPDGPFRLRLLALRLPPEQAAAARRRVHAAARKKGRTPDQRSLLAAEFLIVVTTLDPTPWPAPQVFALYRIRWQIELVFKRLKGLLHLGQLRVKATSPLAQLLLLGKLLAALLVERWTQHVTTSDRCADWWDAVDRPLSAWRWLCYWLDALRTIVHGYLTLECLQASLPKLSRFLCDPPRRRPQQGAYARRTFRPPKSPTDAATAQTFLSHPLPPPWPVS